MSLEDGGRDPYQLDRLADELASRESAHDSENSNGEIHELPLLLPLSHEHPLLTSTGLFDVDAFLLSRPNTSLQDLRSELRDYLAVLKEELVRLINDDYAAFISLRTDLRGEGARLERLEAPLSDVKHEIDKSRVELLGVQQAVQEKLAARADLREEKNLLHLLLKLSDLVVRLETLLLIASPKHSSTSSVDISNLGIRDMHGVLDYNRDGQSATNGVEEDMEDSRSRVGRAKHLSRIAVEYNQLLYHAAKARKEACAFVGELQNRMDRIESTLSRDIDHLFSSTLISLTSTSTTMLASERSRLVTELSECLKIYDMLGKWETAEEVIRRDIVQPFVKKTVYNGVLSVPLSPIIPRTPLPDLSSRPLLSPTTPYTPLSSNLTKPNPFDVSFNANSHTSDHHSTPFDNNDDPLAQLFAKILRFVERDCRPLIDLAERVNASRSYKRNKGRIGALDLRAVRGITNGEDGGNPSDLAGDHEGFEIMADVVWAEIGRAVIDELGTVVFAAGRPDDFQKNYTTTHDFITALEYMAPSADSVAALRAHRTYMAFERRWQLPVYFQLRWKEIVGKLESVLSRPLGDTSATRNDDGFKTSQAYATFVAAQTCWAPEVFIPELGHRFWRLTLQILSRYGTWLENTLPPRTAPPTSDKGDSAEYYAADENSLRAFATALSDMSLLESRIITLYTEEITTLLPSETLSVDEDFSPKRVLSDTLSHFTDFIPDIDASIVNIFIRRCSEPLQHVRSIPSQYRAMSSKKDPTEPSYFVPNILKPLQLFFEADGLGEGLKSRFRRRWTEEVFKAVVTRYTTYLIGIKKAEDSIRRYKKGKKSAFSLFTSNASNAQNDEGRDEERIRVQMVLDVERLAKDAETLGVDVKASEEYAELKALAAAKNE